MTPERIVEAMIEHAVSVELGWDDDGSGYPFDVSEQMMQNLRNKCKREIKLAVQHLNMTISTVAKVYLTDPLIKAEMKQFMNQQKIKGD